MRCVYTASAAAWSSMTMHMCTGCSPRRTFCTG
jgi:hypothetical protein